MIEKKYDYTVTDEKTIERIIDDENINLNPILHFLVNRIFCANSGNSKKLQI